jgi:hypothetical protein
VTSPASVSPGLAVVKRGEKHASGIEVIELAVANAGKDVA